MVARMLTAWLGVMTVLPTADNLDGLRDGLKLGEAPSRHDDEALGGNCKAKLLATRNPNEVLALLRLDRNETM